MAPRLCQLKRMREGHLTRFRTEPQSNTFILQIYSDGALEWASVSQYIFSVEKKKKKTKKNTALNKPHIEISFLDMK